MIQVCAQRCVIQLCAHKSVCWCTGMLQVCSHRCVVQVCTKKCLLTGLCSQVYMHVSVPLLGVVPWGLAGLSSLLAIAECGTFLPDVDTWELLGGMEAE